MNKKQREIKATAEMAFAHSINKACRSELKGQDLVIAVQEACSAREEMLSTMIHFDERPINPLAAWPVK